MDGLSREKNHHGGAEEKPSLPRRGASLCCAPASGRAEGSGLICIPALTCRAINGPSLRDSILVLATFLLLARKVGRRICSQLRDPICKDDCERDPRLLLRRCGAPGETIFPRTTPRSFVRVSRAGECAREPSHPQDDKPDGIFVVLARVYWVIEPSGDRDI